MKIEDLWKDKNYEPNDEQKNSILHTNGPLYITAAPGSGKTAVLVWRTLYLIVFQNVKPEKIFLATFTEKAAFQLKERLQSLLSLVAEKSNGTKGPYDLSKMYIGTIHSLCQRILSDRNFSKDKKRPPQFALMDDLDQFLFLYNSKNYNQILVAGELTDPDEKRVNGRKKAILNIIKSKENSNSQSNVSKFDFIENLIKAFNRFSEEMLSTEDILSQLIDPDKEDRHKVRLVKMYEKYLQLLNSDKRTDFSMIQKLALEHIKKNSEVARQQFDHIIIDEYQDTNYVQEQLVFELSKGQNNICIVGDDDQALYRFRGARVENFVQFKKRFSKDTGFTEEKIKVENLKINYRSKEPIVNLYKKFIEHQFSDPNKKFRVSSKKISAYKKMVSEEQPSLLMNHKADTPEYVFQSIAKFTKSLIDLKEVQPEQIAFLFPSLKNNSAKAAIKALEDQGLKVYAPRANGFLATDEATALFGIYLHIFGKTEKEFKKNSNSPFQKFYEWVENAYQIASKIIQEDKFLKLYIDDLKVEISLSVKNYSILEGIALNNKWDKNDIILEGNRVKNSVSFEKFKNVLENSSLDDTLKKKVKSTRFKNYITNRSVNTAFIYLTSLDWGVLDLFYRITSFKYFKPMFDLASSESGKGIDEGPICNLSLISQYLGKYTERYGSFITSSFLKDEHFKNHFFGSYLYNLYKRDESEYENPDDPFPKGRIPFLTIHQSKGLEFPFVVLGRTFSKDRDLDMEKFIKEIKPKTGSEGEPLEKMYEFDLSRMYYVALSRAERCLIIANQNLKGQSGKDRLLKITSDPISYEISDISKFDVKRFVKYEADKRKGLQEQEEKKKEDFVGIFSFTADYQYYQRCPRQYMIFRKYGFVPSRTQTMFYGSLVHRTLEDMHYEVSVRLNHGNR